MDISYYPPFSKNAPVSSKLPIPIMSFATNTKHNYKGPVALLKPLIINKELAYLDAIKPKCNLPFGNLNLINRNYNIVQAVQAVQAVEAVQVGHEPQEDVIIIKQHKSHKNRYNISITNKGYMCNLCDKIYKDLSYIQLHQKEHSSIETRIKKYKCDKCNHSYTFEKHLVSHQKKHK